MLNKDQAAAVFEKIKKLSTAEEVEALFYGGRSALTRFANNNIHQNVAEQNYGVSVRTVFGGRTARASTNKFDEESLKRVVQASERMARVQQPDSDLLPVPDSPEAGGAGGRAPEAVRHFAETAATNPEQRAEVVGKIVSVASRNKLTAAGIFSNSESVDGLFNSRGLSVWYTQTSSDISVTMLGEDSSGWQKANSPDVSQLDAVRLAEVAAHLSPE